MKSINNISSAFAFTEVGTEECNDCGNVYKLYETPRGILGGCKPCADSKLLKSLNLPTEEEYKAEKALNFILSLEKVTGDLDNASVKNYSPKHDTQLKAKQEAIKFVKEFDGTKSLTFSGSPGLGKSHLAYAITKGVRAKGKRALYIKVTDLFDRIKSTYNQNAKISEEQIFNLMEELDLLVLDDIGSEYVKGNDSGHETWASDVLYKIFDMRLGKSTICTTNYSESDLLKKYGNNGRRIISRMMNNSTGIRLEGEDHRRQGAF